MATVLIPEIGPQTDAEASELYYELCLVRNPPFKSFQYGTFYGTGCRTRRVVAIPIDLGIDRLMSVDDLYTDCWVPSGQGPNICDMSIGRLRVDNFPIGSPLPLDYSYTIFYIPQTDLPAWIPLNTCPPVVRAGVPWYGNILVVRHGRRKAVVNIEDYDARLVDLIVASFILDGTLA
ncbi:hypothetical protein B0H10DRAFT_2123487 [Mycena sp. CBHHK59/15]|nr:hypothetical protein B0H10DRAFT_2123487 [Mycena sp. CBHHK59/15]